MEMKRIIYLAVAFFCYRLLVACAPQPPLDMRRTPPCVRSSISPRPIPEVNFAVMTDLHTYDPYLGTDGKAFENYVAGDYKLTKESAEILQTAIGQIKVKMSASYWWPAI